MSLSDEYRVRAAELRAKADRQLDPLFRSMFEKLARTYLRQAELADLNRGDARTRLASRPSSAFADAAGRYSETKPRIAQAALDCSAIGNGMMRPRCVAKLAGSSIL